MSWQAWVFLSIFCTSISFILTRYQRLKLGTLQTTFWQYVGSSITAILLFFLLKIQVIAPSKFFLPYLAGMYLGIGAIALVKAFGYNLSKTMTVFSFRSHLSTLLFAIFMNEYLLFNPQTVPGLFKITALVISALSFILLSKKKDQAKPTKSWLLYSITAIIVMGSYNFFAKIIASDFSPSQAIICQYFGALTSVGLITFFKRTNIFFGLKSIIISLLRGCFFAFGWYFLFHAYKIGSGSLTVLMEILGNTLIPVIYGLIFFSEYRLFNKKNYLGIILGIISLVLLVI